MSGDFEFYMDGAVFQRPDGTMLQEIYFRFANSEIAFKRTKETYRARIEFTIAIKDEQGNAYIDDSFTLDFYEEDEEKIESPVDFQTVIKRYKLAPGRYELSCSVKDLQSPKVTVLSMISGQYKTSAVYRRALNIPFFDPDKVSISDPMFLWKIQRDSGVPVFHPNPPRLYGLYKDSLEVYLELYLPDSLGGEETLRFESFVLNEKGETLEKSSVPLEEREKLAEREARVEHGQFLVYPLIVRKDLTVFPAGSYALYANIRLKNGLIGRFRCGSFSVAWDLRTWEVSQKSFLAEARFLLGDEEFAKFRRESPGEQERLLQELWDKLDPTPRTNRNEVHEEYLQRLEYVNAHYSDYQEGSFSDRGLIYLKYGEPDEIVAEVVPLNRESLSDAIEKVENRYYPVSFSTHGARESYQKPKRDILVDPRRIGVVGEGGNVAYPYELWIYNGSGNPILERDRVLEPDIGLRFIFIDREGYGRYKLESSSSMTNK